MRIAGFSTAPGTTNQHRDGHEVNKTGGIKADLQYGMEAGDVEGKLAVTTLDMKALQPYLDRYTKMDLLSGQLTTELAISMDAEARSAPNGFVQIDKFEDCGQAPSRRTSSSGI